MNGHDRHCGPRPSNEPLERVSDGKPGVLRREVLRVARDALTASAYAAPRPSPMATHNFATIDAGSAGVSSRSLSHVSMR